MALSNTMRVMADVLEELRIEDALEVCSIGIMTIHLQGGLFDKLFPNPTIRERPSGIYPIEKSMPFKGVKFIALYNLRESWDIVLNIAEAEAEEKYGTIDEVENGKG